MITEVANVSSRNLLFDSMKDILKHTISSEHQERTREMIIGLDEAEAPRLKLKPKLKINTKGFIYPKHKPQPKGASPLVPQPKDNIYSRIKFRCEVCNEEFKNKRTLNSHSYSHNRLYLENTKYFDINSSLNMREFYFTNKSGNYLEDIDEVIINSLEEIKYCYQFRKVKSFKYKITAKYKYKKRTKEEVKTTNKFFNTH